MIILYSFIFICVIFLTDKLFFAQLLKKKKIVYSSINYIISALLINVLEFIKFLCI